MLLLGLAPELDPRFQRCIGFLLDDMGRRVGTLGLYVALLGGPARIRSELAEAGALAGSRVFEGSAGHLSAADEPLRIDPFLADWLLGDRDGLAADPRVRRALRVVAWPGAGLLTEREELANAESLIHRLRDSSQALWALLEGDDPAGWRALIELGATMGQVEPIRIEASRFTGADVVEVEECARRVARMARLTGAPLVVDAAQDEMSEAEDDGMRLFLSALSNTPCQGALICRDEARAARLLEAASYDLIGDGALSKTARVAAVRAAAAGADAYLTEDAAAGIAAQYPMHIDDLEHAMRLARSMPIHYGTTDPRLERFLAASKQVASEGVSHLAERVEPIFSLDDVVLPSDRKDQLNEIVDNVRFAPAVLDGWKFREQLPYGRGVTALFFGPSGTGKTMAAMGIARSLGVQVLRLDLSMVVSKYIGETEKHIDRVFTDAQRSGSAILIDEADALLGKRSEVKDAHDRYANIEVAYLLQRMEAYEGLAILTTNQKQNLDKAFVRRIRFMVDFPRPDVEAREKIWRHCLPAGSYVLDDAAFRQLARRLDVTGGHIRQITLRAAFLAAAAGELIGLKHISQAARAEFAKLGMPPVELDLGETKRAA
ncbi:MAG: ATP-binding protein [Acidobacteriota bacterium]|nr:ATP-binding protein [Acidobacteriota bacterium]